MNMKSFRLPAVTSPRLQAYMPHVAVGGAIFAILILGGVSGERRAYFLLAVPVALAHFLWGGLLSGVLAAGLALIAFAAGARGGSAVLVPLFVAGAWGASRLAIRAVEAELLNLRRAREEDELAAATITRELEDERRRLSASRNRIERIGMLTDVASDLSATLDLPDVVGAALRRTRELTGQAGEPRIVLFAGDDARVYRSGEAGVSVAREEPDALLQWVRARGLPLMVEDLQRDLRFRSVTGELPRARAVIAAPLMQERAVAGVLAVESAAPGAFSQEDWRLLSPMADLTAVAIQNAMLYQRTQEEAITDGLTEVFVHRYFMDRFSHELRRAREQGIPLVLLMADIDNFKSCNDTYGHLAGDAVLKRVARALKDGVRGTDLVARYGGEEFAVLLVETGREAAQPVAERLRASVEATAVADLGLVKGVTISMGLAEFPRNASDERGLVERADEALYQAKREGKNRVVTAPG